IPISDTPSAFQSPTTGTSFVRPTPNTPYVSEGSPSHCQLLFLSRYHMPSWYIPISDIPSPFQSPTTGTSPVSPIPKTPSWSVPSPSHCQLPFTSRYHRPSI